MSICTCGFGRPGETCLGNRSDCLAKDPCRGGQWLVDPNADFRRQGGSARGLCSVCGKEPRKHQDRAGAGLKTRPIPFSSEMVKAVLERRKWQTRRVILEPDHFGCLTGDCPHDAEGQCAASMASHSPYGVAGDKLWVREAFRGPVGLDASPPRDFPASAPIWYEAGGKKNITNAGKPGKLRPGMFMPRWASRLLLDVVSVRYERLQAISEADAKAEGVEALTAADGGFVKLSGLDYVGAYRILWDHLNAARSYTWSSNPWVWVVHFKPS